VKKKKKKKTRLAGDDKTYPPDCKPCKDNSFDTARQPERGAELKRVPSDSGGENEEGDEAPGEAKAAAAEVDLAIKEADIVIGRDRLGLADELIWERERFHGRENPLDQE
jgi:hypothetical protein